MHMAVSTRRWMRADLQRLPDDGNRYEVVRGALFVTPPPSTYHEALVHVLADHLRPYVASMRLGRVIQAPSALVFDRSEVQPDLMVRASPLPPPATWEEMPLPILAVEILSRSTRRRDVIEKRALFMDAGVAEYWIVDGKSRTIRVVRADAEYLATEALEWHPEGSSESFILDVAAMFREALG